MIYVIFYYILYYILFIIFYYLLYSIIYYIIFYVLLYITYYIIGSGDIITLCVYVVFHMFVSNVFKQLFSVDEIIYNLLVLLNLW